MNDMISNAMIQFREMIDLQKKIQVGEKEYIKDGFKAVLESTIDPIEISTLTGIVDFIDHKIEFNILHNNLNALDRLHIHVKSPTQVYLESDSFGPWLQRHVLVYSRALVTDFVFGRAYNPEEFIISLLSQFQATEHRDSLLYACSNITKESVGTVKDSGHSQKMEVKQGISMRRDVEFKNPVILQPYRTFPEIQQPESEFVFRIHERDDISCSLHEADGSAWKLKAILAIRDYFQEQLPDIPVIA